MGVMGIGVYSQFFVCNVEIHGRGLGNEAMCVYVYVCMHICGYTLT